MREFRNVRFYSNIDELPFENYLYFYSYYQLSKLVNIDLYQDPVSIISHLSSLLNAYLYKGLDAGKYAKKINEVSANAVANFNSYIPYCQVAFNCIIAQKKIEGRWERYTPSLSDVNEYETGIFYFESNEVITQLFESWHTELKKRYPTFFDDDFAEKIAAYNLEAILEVDFTKKNWYDDFDELMLQKAIYLMNETDDIDVLQSSKDFFATSFVASQKAIAIQLGWAVNDIKSAPIDLFFATIEVKAKEAKERESAIKQ